jgi:YidC/Oxa1 family membrane protein insertase
MNAIYEFFHLFGIQNIALSIIVFTFIVKAIMLPLTIKQQKFTKLSSRMNPELQKIQAKYKGKKDEASLRKQQEETQIVYEKYGASPTSGCLPLLISLPIMFALYQVINNIPAYVGQVKNLYEVVALQIHSITGYEDILKKLAEGASNIRTTEVGTTNQVIDMLAKFGSSQWTKLAESFPTIGQTISNSYVDIQQVNTFLGMNITNAPGWAFPGILIPILAMSLQFLQGKQLEVKNKSSNTQDQSAQMMKSMNVVMPIMSGVFCITLPTGIGLYWIATSVFTIMQQFFVNKYMDKVDVDELIKKNVAKASKKVSRKKSTSSQTTTTPSLQELARKQTKSIETSSNNNYEKLSSNDNATEVEEASVSTKADSSSNGAKSISDIANLLKNRNDKGDK